MAARRSGWSGCCASIFCSNRSTCRTRRRKRRSTTHPEEFIGKNIRASHEKIMDGDDHRSRTADRNDISRSIGLRRYGLRRRVGVFYEEGHGFGPNKKGAFNWAPLRIVPRKLSLGICWGGDHELDHSVARILVRIDAKSRRLDTIAVDIDETSAERRAKIALQNPKIRRG